MKQSKEIPQHDFSIASLGQSEYPSPYASLRQNEASSTLHHHHTLASEHKQYDVVVVGGGMSGLCAALACARHGARTALIHDRPVLGGNASSEVRMHICGAMGETHDRPNGRETGIIEEILLENAYRNPQHSYSIFDTILWEKARFQENLELYLNTHMHAAQMHGNAIASIEAHQMTTEKQLHFTGRFFIDATGDGLLAVLAGCASMRGREGKQVFGESLAPDETDSIMMGNTVLFQAKRMEHPMPFTKPHWAYSYTKEDFAHRSFDDITSGYWWVELGGGSKDTIRDGEFLRDELIKTVYGVWDYIKNSGGFDSEHLALDWVGFVPGKRESRRIVGLYILTQKDLLPTGDHSSFEDAVAYGGWPIDLHIPQGLESKEPPTRFNHLPQVYPIPLRALQARDVENLFLAGRAISVSHVAFGSTSVMATCAVVGQAVGTAAAYCIKFNVASTDFHDQVKELQQLLLKDDCHIPGLQLTDSNDLAPKADQIIPSSFQPGCEGQQVVNGKNRGSDTASNCWVSGTGGFPQSIALYYDNPIQAREICITFDSNLSRENMLSISDSVMQRYHQGLPPELVRSYDVQLLNKGKSVFLLPIEENHQRQRKHALPSDILFDTCEIRIYSTHGDEKARVFGVSLM